MWQLKMGQEQERCARARNHANTDITKWKESRNGGGPKRGHWWTQVDALQLSKKIYRWTPGRQKDAKAL